MSIIKRGKTYHLKRRVPKRFASVDARPFIYKSFKTDSEEEARSKADAYWRELLGAWEAELAGQGVIAQERFDAAKNLAERRGYKWMPANEVATLPLDQILERVEATRRRDGTSDKFRGEAFVGGAKVPKLTVSGALDSFWSLSADRIKGKSDDQKRRWKNPRIKAINNFIEVNGDIALADLNANHMLDFREWWWERIENEDLNPHTANKDFIHLGNITKTVAKMRRLGFIPPVSGYNFTEDKVGKRPPFPTEFIKTRLLKEGALSGLNDEARTILLGMVNTGYRPSEGAALAPDRICLEGKIPYIHIAPDGRALKTRRAERQIPLAGISLEVFQAMPLGTPRYRDKPGLTATLNKFLRENKLTPSAEHTTYSLRHSFEDRLLTAGVDERVRRDLMGHRLTREEYGDGGGLEVRHKAILSIAL